MVDVSAGSAIQPVWKERYDMLDGWRGIAAFFVLLHHVSSVRFGAEAVILFFVISGYCITAAAEAASRKGMGFRQFMLRRVRRIYPPYLASIAFLAIPRALKAAAGYGTFRTTPLIWIQQLTLTQWTSLLLHPKAHADENTQLFVAAYWSLGYEEQFYLVMGVLMVGVAFLNRRMVLATLMLVALAWNLAMPHEVRGIFIEYWPHFALGSLLFYRLCRMRGAAIRRWTDVTVAALVIVYGALAWRDRGFTDAARPVNYEMFVAAAFALLLLAMRPFNDRFKASHAGRALMWLGLISYSLYLINQFNVGLVTAIAGHIVPARMPEVFRTIAKVIAELMIAVVFWYACERPFLNRPIVPPSGGPPAPRDEVVVITPATSTGE